MDDRRPTRRSWFRFSLRTLFVFVTAVAVCLGGAMNWVRQRHQFLARDVVLHEAERMTDEPIYAGDDGHAQFGWIETEPPWVLGLLGERGIARITVQTPQDEIDARRLFPESQVEIGHWQSRDDDYLP